MKAYTRINAQTQEVQLQEVPMPTIQDDEVLIQVKAFWVGIHDRYFIPGDAKFPYVIGTEGTGIITKIGDKVTKFSLGDKVIFTTTLQSQGGSWAEYAAAKSNTLIPLPDTLSFPQGATIPIAGKTALECMQALELKKWDTLFIVWASGAIGTLVIQLASQAGIHVSASASQKNHTYMQSLGAERTVDYHDKNWTKEILDWSQGWVNAALAIQPGTGIDAIKTVKDHWRVITVSGDNTTITPERDITIAQMGHNKNTNSLLIDLVDSLASGNIKVVIEQEFELEDAMKALEKTETRHARGKLVVRGL